MNINYIMKIYKKIYPQVYLEQCNHGIKKKMMGKYIDVEAYSGDSDDSNNSDDSSSE